MKDDEGLTSATGVPVSEKQDVLSEEAALERARANLALLEGRANMQETELRLRKVERALLPKSFHAFRPTQVPPGVTAHLYTNLEQPGFVQGLLVHAPFSLGGLTVDSIRFGTSLLVDGPVGVPGWAWFPLDRSLAPFVQVSAWVTNTSGATLDAHLALVWSVFPDLGVSR